MATRSHYASDESYARSLASSRRWKQRQTGTCEACGSVTRYNGQTANGPSRECLVCANRRIALSKRGTGPIGEALIGFVDGEVRSFTEIRLHLGISASHTVNILNRLVGYGLVERVARGRYRKVAA